MTVSPESTAAATTIVRNLTGKRWVWPPMRVVELYAAPVGAVMLRGLPVIEVFSVKDKRTDDDIEYERYRNLLEFTSGRRFCTIERRVLVDYSYGNQPSGLIGNAINVLAQEIELANSQSVECRIPDRVTSVNRQGTSWTLIDPQDFLNEGRTGITEVDMAIIASGSAKARARLFTPDYPPPRRVSATQLEVTP